jgi:hypothetical protein
MLPKLNPLPIPPKFGRIVTGSVVTGSVVTGSVVTGSRIISGGASSSGEGGGGTLGFRGSRKLGNSSGCLKN